MKQLKRDLLAVLKSLKTMQQKAERMMSRLEGLEKASAPKKAALKKATSKGKAAKKSRRVTDTDKVLTIIRKNRKGVNVAILKQKTGFKDAKVRSIVYNLKKQGKVISPAKGLYTKP